MHVFAVVAGTSNASHNIQAQLTLDRHGITCLHPAAAQSAGAPPLRRMSTWLMHNVCVSPFMDSRACLSRVRLLSYRCRTCSTCCFCSCSRMRKKFSSSGTEKSSQGKVVSSSFSCKASHTPKCVHRKCAPGVRGTDWCYRRPTAARVRAAPHSGADDASLHALM